MHALRVVSLSNALSKCKSAHASVICRNILSPCRKLVCRRDVSVRVKHTQNLLFHPKYSYWSWRLPAHHCSSWLSPFLCGTPDHDRNCALRSGGKVNEKRARMSQRGWKRKTKRVATHIAEDGYREIWSSCCDAKMDDSPKKNPFDAAFQNWPSGVSNLFMLWTGEGEWSGI